MGLGRRSPITPGRRPSTERIWNKTNLGTVGSKVPPFVKPVLSGDDQAKLDNSQLRTIIIVCSSLTTCWIFSYFRHIINDVDF